MPLDKSGSKASIGKNISAEMHAGKPQNQAIAIAMDVMRRARRAMGGPPVDPKGPPELIDNSTVGSRAQDAMGQGIREAGQERHAKTNNAYSTFEEMLGLPRSDRATMSDPTMLGRAEGGPPPELSSFMPMLQEHSQDVEHRNDGRVDRALRSLDKTMGFSGEGNDLGDSSGTVPGTGVFTPMRADGGKAKRQPFPDMLGAGRTVA